MKVRNINNAKHFAIKSANYGTAAKNDAKNVSFKGMKGMQSGMKWIADNFSSPHQRAILGITALCTQPFIDLYNSHIKKEDKPITVSKTIAKIIAGTLVGISLRYYAIKAVKNFTKEVSSGKYSQCLLPKHIIEKLKLDKSLVPKAYLLNYRNGLGTFIGVMGGLLTNFFIDAPLSKKLTNVIHDNFLKKENVSGK